jgi:hypothetical protein
MSNVPFAVVGGLALSALLSACEGGTCGKVLPCGGNVVGDWVIGGSCYDPTTLAVSGCPGYRVRSSGIKIRGSFSYGADQLYTRTLRYSGTQDIEIPVTCLSAGAQPTTCEQLDAQLQTAIATSNSPIGSAGCASSAGMCHCNVGYRDEPLVESGNYTVFTTTIYHSGSTSGVGGSYCVQGDVMHLVTIDSTVAGMMTISSDIVAHRR